MHSRLKTWGLSFAALALVVIAFLLPLHSHAEKSGAVQPAHCQVCQFSGDAHALAMPTMASISPLAITASTIVLASVQAEPFFSFLIASPRAPPVA